MAWKQIPGNPNWQFNDDPQLPVRWQNMGYVNGVRTDGVNQVYAQVRRNSDPDDANRGEISATYYNAKVGVFGIQPSSYYSSLPSIGGGAVGYILNNSLRFNDNDSAYLSRTPTSAGNRRTWTWSGWVKRGNISTLMSFAGAGNNIEEQTGLSFNAANQINLFMYSRSQTGLNQWTALGTTSTFDDMSTWYHVVIACDTTQAIVADRFKIYVNGEEQSYIKESGIDLPLNVQTAFNNNVTQYVGATATTFNKFDGYLSEIHFIDGQALTPSDFGETDSVTSNWVAKQYSGTYGDNGYYLQFENNASLGEDTSGNTNNWTPVNLATTDQMIDTPTNNFSVLQNSPTGTGVTYQEGNLEFFNASSNTAKSGSTILFSSGKWYCEGLPINNTTLKLGWYGIRNPVTDDFWVYYASTGQAVSSISGTGTFYTYGASYQNGDVMGIAYDGGTGNLTFYKNGVSQGVLATGFQGQELEFNFGDASGTYNHSGVANFGQDSSFAGNKTRQGNTDANGVGDFYYTPPAGYLALCSQNIN